MIPSEFKHRFLGDSAIDIATHELDAVFPDGEKQRVILRLGAPYQQDGFTKIRVELEGLDSTDGPITGEGSLHALVLAIGFIIRRLEVFERARGCRYLWPGSSDVFNYREVFSTLDDS